MTTVYKVLGQVVPTLGAEADLYAAANPAVVSTITVCNQGSGSTLFRLSVSAGGGATATKDYLYYNVPIAGYDTFAATFGITLATGDKIRAYIPSGALVSFSAFGSEIS
jgi:hypothetical protein